MEIKIDNRTQIIVFFVFLALIIAWNLLTLGISPLPWFDEAFYFSMSHNFIENGVLEFTFAPPDIPMAPRRYYYGPVYFWLTSLSMSVIGQTPVGFRIVGLLFSFCLLIPLWNLIKQQGIKIVLLILILLDPLMISGSHSGRMDTLALFFVLTSLYFAPIWGEDSKRYFRIVVAALAFAAALLTNPRIYFLGIPYFYFLFIQLRRTDWKSDILRWALFGGVIVILYVSWIFYGFGSIEQFVDVYRALMEKFNGVGLYIPIFHYPLIALVISMLACAVWFDFRRLFEDPVIIYSVLGVVMFYLLIKDTGAYSILILPFYYILLARTSKLTSEMFNFPRLRVIVLIGLLFLNLAFFGVKNYVLWSTFENRNIEEVDDFIAENVPSGSRLLGDEMYFYSTLRNGSDFQFIHLFLDRDSREEYHRMEYDYQYVFWSDRLAESDPGLFALYNAEGKLKEVARLERKPDKKSRLFNLLKDRLLNSYSGTLYKRIP